MLKSTFWNTSLGHLVSGLAVTVALYLASSVVNDPTLANQVGVGGILVSFAKGLIDFLRPGITNLPVSNQG